MRHRSSRRLPVILAVIVGFLTLLAGPVGAHPDPGGGSEADSDLHRHDPSDALEALDAINSSNVVSDGPSAKVTKNLDVAGRGERNVFDATTDVWAHDGYAYTGTFNVPCGGDPDAGIWVWDVHNKNKPSFVTVIPSPTGSRTNDVRVEEMNSGDILVHSNEVCGAGGRGGFEIYDVSDPANAVLLASVQTDDVNLFVQQNFGFVDFGVHNLWLFTQGDRDYVVATVESLFGNFQIFDITDPTNPTRVGFWGAEQLEFPGIDWVDLADFGTILDANAYLTSGFGASDNRFLHDVTITDDGTHAYLANWDAGLVLLDISDPSASDARLGGHRRRERLARRRGQQPLGVAERRRPDRRRGRGGLLGLGGLDPADQPDPGTGRTRPATRPFPGTAVSTEAGDFLEASPTGLTGSTDGTSVVVDGGPTFDAVEFATAAGSPTFADTGTVSGNLVWVGRACGLTEGDVLENALAAGDIAIIRRGACEFDEKARPWPLRARRQSSSPTTWSRPRGPACGSGTTATRPGRYWPPHSTRCAAPRRHRRRSARRTGRTPATTSRSRPGATRPSPMCRGTGTGCSSST